MALRWAYLGLCALILSAETCTFGGGVGVGAGRADSEQNGGREDKLSKLRHWPVKARDEVNVPKSRPELLHSATHDTSAQISQNPKTVQSPWRPSFASSITSSTPTPTTPPPKNPVPAQDSRQSHQHPSRREAKRKISVLKSAAHTSWPLPPHQPPSPTPARPAASSTSTSPAPSAARQVWAPVSPAVHQLHASAVGASRPSSSLSSSALSRTTTLAPSPFSAVSLSRTSSPTLSSFPSAC